MTQDLDIAEGDLASHQQGGAAIPAAASAAVKLDASSSDDDGEPPAAKENELVVIVGKHYPSYRYADIFVRYPTVSLFVTFAAFLTFAFIYLTSSSIETVGSLGLFEGSGPDSTAFRTATNAVDAWSTVVRLNSIYGSRLPAMPDREIFITYRAEKDTPSILEDKGSLQAIAMLEQKISAERAYVSACWNSPRRGPGINQFGLAAPCTPINSLMQYYYPGTYLQANGDAAWQFTVAPAPTPQVPLLRMAQLVRSNPNWPYYSHSTSDTDMQAVDVIRTSILLSSNSNVTLDNAETAIATILEASTELDGGSILVSYGGGHYYEKRIKRLIASDTLIVMSLFIVIFAPLAIHFHSKIMALMSILMLLCLYPCGIFLYFLCTGDGEISLLNVLSYVMVIVAALQAQTVFFTTFVQSGSMATTGTKNTLTVAQRLSYTFRSAGLGITCATVVSLSCFAAVSNVPIPAVKQFGSILVVLTVVLWAMMFTVFPSMTMLHHFYISKSRRNAQKKKEFLLEKQKHDRNPTTARYFRAVEQLKKQYASRRGDIPPQVVAAYMPSNPAALDTYQALCEKMNKQLDADVATFATADAGTAGSRVKSKLRGLVGKWRDEPSASRIDHGTVSHGGMTDGGGGQLTYEEQVLRDFDAAVEARQATGTVPPLAVDKVTLVGHVSCDHFDGNRVEAARKHLHQSKVTSVYDMTTEHLVVVGKYFGVLPSPSSALRVERRGAFGESSSLDELRLEDIYNHDSPVRGGGEEAERDQDHAASRRDGSGDIASLIMRSGTTGTLIKQLMYTMFGIAACIGPRVSASRIQSPISGPTTRPAPSTGGSTTPPPAPPTRSAFVRWMQELTGRERTFVFFGRRTDETPADRRSRILALKDTSTSFSSLERFLYETYAPALHHARFVCLAALAVLVVLSAVASSRLSVSTSPQTFLSSSDAIGRYVAESRLFATGSCAVCSPYFFSASQLGVTYRASAACSATFGVDLMFASVDKCGTCLGNGSSCYNCGGFGSGPHAVDTCGQCLSPSDARFNGCITKCSPAAKTTNCTHCQLDAGYPSGVVGPSCTKTCIVGPSCPANRGECNIITGRCDCFTDPVRGYFSGNYCGKCLDSSLALPDCLRPIDAGSVGCPGYIPGSCTVVDPSICDSRYGTLSPDGTSCNCYVVGQGGPNCGLNTQCNNRGVFDTSSGYCACKGMTFGSSCQYCGCLNGGACDAYGNCACQGSWTGTDCSRCPATVIAHQSVCPTPWSPSQYPTLELCQQAFCSLKELENGPASPFTFCGLCTSVAGTTPLSHENTQATCTGFWAGDMCDVCSGSNGDDGVSCDAQGFLVGCDGVRTASATAVTKSNRCGVCGGDTSAVCYGCDGVLYSRMQLSSCGVCAPVESNLSSSCSGSEPLSQIYLFWGLQDGFDATDPRVQLAMFNVLRRLQARNSRLLSPQLSSYFYLEYVAWLNSNNMTFPVVPQTSVLFSLSQFSSLTGRQADVGLSSISSGSRTVTYIRQLLVSPFVHDSLAYDQLQDYRQQFRRALDDAMSILSPSDRAALGSPVLVSKAWVNMEAQWAIIHGITQALVIGVFVFSACALLITRSLRLSLLGLFAFISNILAVLALYFVLGWGLGTVELITVGIVLGSASSQIMHFVESYREALHAAQSHLLGNKVSPLKGLQASFQRHGTPFIVSFFSVVVSCCVFYACGITLLHRVATTIILCTLLNALHVFVLLPGLLSIFAPSQISQRRSRRIVFAVIGTIRWEGKPVYEERSTNDASHRDCNDYDSNHKNDSPNH